MNNQLYWPLKNNTPSTPDLVGMDNDGVLNESDITEHLHLLDVNHAMSLVNLRHKGMGSASLMEGETEEDILYISYIVDEAYQEHKAAVFLLHATIEKYMKS